MNPQNTTEQLRATSLALDSDGNAYVTGVQQTPSQGSNILTVKFSPDGTPLWHDLFAGAAGDPVALRNDSSGAFYVADSFHAAPDNADFVLLRYDAEGQREWPRARQ